jgi:hypothetical protein
MALYENFADGESWASTYGAQWSAQTFTVGTVATNENFDITSVKIKGYTPGDPGTVTVSIRAVDVNGLPTDSDLSSGTFDGGSVPGAYPGDWFEITMSAYEIQASTKYAIVVRISETSSANELRWIRNTTDGYAGGNYCVSINSGSSWSAGATNDLPFEVYGTASGGEPPTGTGQFINIGDVMKPISEMYVNVGDVLKPVAEAYINVGDVLKPLFT